MAASEPFVDVAAELYTLPPADFTAARNDAVTRARDAGARDLAARLKALRKPATSAWVVNLLVREAPGEVGGMLDLGTALQQAQADLDADAMRDLNRQRRALITSVARRGRALAKDHGVALSQAVTEQVEQTLHAAMVAQDAANAVRTGMLIEPLAPEGFGGLKVADAMARTALGVSSKPASSTSAVRKGVRRRADLHTVPEAEQEVRRRRVEEREQARREATAAVEEAERRQAEARAELDGREAALSELEAACLQVNGEIDELRRRIDELEDRLERLDEESDEARAERDGAAAEMEAAARAVEHARERLDGLGRDRG